VFEGWSHSACDYSMARMVRIVGGSWRRRPLLRRARGYFAGRSSLTRLAIAILTGAAGPDFNKIQFANRSIIGLLDCGARDTDNGRIG
jgi:hypothetical protein